MKFCPALLFALPFFATSAQVSDQFDPESQTGVTKKAVVQSDNTMVVTANPLATKAASDILAKGGSATDAMIAAQLVLGLVEPQSSGIGGGAFLLHYHAAAKKLTSYDGRETAPATADSKLFVGKNGKTMAFFDAVIGGRSVGTPGIPALLWETHQKHGKLPWTSLFQPAIELAEQGFIVSPRLAALIDRDQKHLKKHASTRAYFFNENGEPLKAGDKLINKAYADTLHQLATKGVTPFYQGKIAKQLIQTVNSHKDNPGLLSSEDMASYRVIARNPVCFPFYEYRVCGMGEPSSGALTLGQMLMILEQTDIRSSAPQASNTLRMKAAASRLAFADRALYMADPDFNRTPGEQLLAPDYIKSRSQQIKSTDKALEAVTAGVPAGTTAWHQSPQTSLSLPATTHLSIRDAKGNLVSMTSSIENVFGARVMTGGFLLNNQLTDFSFQPMRDGKPIANRVEGGKRPRSSMSPVIVFKDDNPNLVLGSPGGSSIIPYVANTLIAHLAWQQPLQQAIEQPHMLNKFGTYELEQGTAAEAQAEVLKKLGYKVKIKPLNSGLHGFTIDGDGKAYSGTDPRREGLAQP